MNQLHNVLAIITSTHAVTFSYIYIYIIISYINNINNNNIYVCIWWDDGSMAELKNHQDDGYVCMWERGNERQREMGLREWTKWMNERLVETTTTMLICHAYNWLLLLLLLLWVYRVYICNQYWHCPYVWMVYSYANTKGSYVCRMSTIEVHIYIYILYI